MNYPKPAPMAKLQAAKNAQKLRVGGKSRNSKLARKKRHIPEKRINYIVTDVHGVEHDFQARESLDDVQIGTEFYAQKGVFVRDIRRKPYSPPEHLQARPFANNDALRELQKRLHREVNQ